MKRTYLLLACLAATLVLIAACPAKAKIPPQPPILPPPVVIPPQAEKPAPTPIPPPTPVARADLKTIYFDFDKSIIRSEDARILEGNAAYLKGDPAVKVTLEGYCDPLGTEEYNRGLGLRRANTAKAYLAKLGITADRMSVVSFGKERLVTTNPAEYELNRRVEFKEK
jgi:peptidoglycan-associated lipoprotein